MSSSQSVYTLPTGQLSVSATLAQLYVNYLNSVSPIPFSGKNTPLWQSLQNGNPLPTSLFYADALQMANQPGLTDNLNLFKSQVESVLNNMPTAFATFACNLYNQFQNVPIAIRGFYSDSSGNSYEDYINANFSVAQCVPYSEAGQVYGVAVTINVSSWSLQTLFYDASSGSTTTSGSFAPQTPGYVTLLIPFKDTPSILAYTPNGTNYPVLWGPSSVLTQNASNITPYTPTMIINGTTPTALRGIGFTPFGVGNTLVSALVQAFGQALEDTIVGSTINYDGVASTLCYQWTSASPSGTSVSGCNYPNTTYLTSGVPFAYYTGSTLPLYSSVSESYQYPIYVGYGNTNAYGVGPNNYGTSTFSKVCSFAEYVVNKNSGNQVGYPADNIISYAYSFTMPSLPSPVVPPHNLNFYLTYPVNLVQDLLPYYLETLDDVLSSINDGVSQLDANATVILTPAIQQCSSITVQTPNRGTLTFKNVNAMINAYGIPQIILGYDSSYIISDSDTVTYNCIQVADMYQSGASLYLAPVPLSEVYPSKVLPQATAVQLYGSSPIQGKYTGVTTFYDTNNAQQIGKLNNNTVDMTNIVYYPANYIYQLATPTGITSITTTTPQSGISTKEILALAGLGLLAIGAYAYEKKKKGNTRNV